MVSQVLAGGAAAAFTHMRASPGATRIAPTGDLVIGRVIGKVIRSSCDLGAGRFEHVWQPGSMTVHGVRAEVWYDCETPAEHVALSVPYARLVALGEDADLPRNGDFGALHARPFADPLIGAIIDRMWSEAQRGDRAGGLFVDSAIATLAHLLARAMQRAAGPAAARGMLAPWQVRRVQDLMDSQISETLTLVELARSVGLSPFHFARAFRRTTGQPPHRYQLARRLARARQMLESTDLPVAAIAAAVGYESTQALARLFVRGVGLSPSAYRRRYKG